MSTSTSFAVLFAHQSFVRSLARSLVADDHAAADVEQDVWLDAIDRPPEDRGAPRGAAGLRPSSAARRSPRR